jgi:hypothetical protein
VSVYRRENLKRGNNMAQETATPYTKKSTTGRRHRVRPLNHRRSLGPKSAFSGIKKRKRGQGS